MVVLEDELAERLDKINKIFSPDVLLKRQAGDPASIAKYYRKNRLAYRIFNSHEGFVHMGISEGKTLKPLDFYKQAKLVQKTISLTKARDVLELAPGKGTTMRYLARRNPATSFYGIDLPHGQMNPKTKEKNMSLGYGDFHDLGAYGDDSMDIVYVIEALCHSADKQRVIREVRRVLRKGGRFIVIDGYFTKKPADYSSAENTAVALVAASMMVTSRDQGYAEFLKSLEAEGFQLEANIDYTKNILPSLYRLESKAKKLIEHPRRGRIITALIGDIIAANAVAGYLMPLCVENRLFEYRYTVAISGL